MMTIGRFVLGLVFGLSISWCCRADEPIRGVGSSAAHPVYRIWSEQYARSGGVALNYDPAGSSAGLKSIRARESDFGASDVAPSRNELERDGLLIFPTAITGAVPVFNLPLLRGASLVLSGEVMAAIFMGDINEWNDTRIQSLNPGVLLPAQRIIPVVRSDGSGTTHHFSDYLAKVDAGWKERMGVGSRLKWPEGVVAAQGSKGVALKVAATVGGISYVDYNYVLEYQLKAAKLRLPDGSLVDAGPNSFRNALMRSSWVSKGDFTQALTNISGKGVWPITMGTFVLMPRVAKDVGRTQATIRFFTWAFIHGDDLAARANFVRLPDSIQAKSYRTLATIQDSQGASIKGNDLASRM